MTKEKQSATADSDRKAYIAALDKELALVGDRDPLTVFAETEGKLRAATAGLNDGQLRTPEKPAKWSVLDVAWHLADVEIVLGFRYRMVVAQSGDAIPAIRQDAWVAELNDGDRGLDDAIEDFARVRQVNLRFLKGLRPEHYERFAMHEERGKETLRFMVRLYAAHDLYHLNQIERIKAAMDA